MYESIKDQNQGIRELKKFLKTHNFKYFRENRQATKVSDTKNS